MVDSIERTHDYMDINSLTASLKSLSVPQRPGFFMIFWYFSKNQGIFCVIAKITWNIVPERGGSFLSPEKKSEFVASPIIYPEPKENSLFSPKTAVLRQNSEKNRF